MLTRIALSQISPRTGDIEGNTSRMLGWIEQAREQKADVVVFPEMSVCGYCLDEKLMISRRFLAQNKEAVARQIAPASRGLAVIVGFLDYDETQTGADGFWARYNGAAVCVDGHWVQTIHKCLLPNYRYFEDRRYFQPGTPGPVVALPLRGRQVKVGLQICEDLFDEHYCVKPTETLARAGSEIIITISASPYVCSSPGQRDGKRFQRDALLRRHVQEQRLPMVFVNTVGLGDNGKNLIPFDGGSAAYDGAGRLVASAGQFHERQVMAELDLDSGTGIPIEDDPFDREAEMFEALAMSVREYFQQQGHFSGILESLSGGVDSALGTAIAVAAVGPDVVAALSLPSRFNSEVTQGAASKIAANLGIEYHVVPIQPIVDCMTQTFETGLGPVRCATTLENLQARIRGMILMARSNDRGELLLSNGNETEIATGYSTLYGDMCGGIAVIGDVSKMDVYRLARYVNRRWGRPIIPAEVFEIQPSAELAPGQVDPFDYAVVSPMIAEFIVERRTPREVCERFERRQLDAAQFGADVYQRYDVKSFTALVDKTYRQLQASVYKRLQGPPIIALSDRAFGFDLRETLLNLWNPQENRS